MTQEQLAAATRKVKALARSERYTEAFELLKRLIADHPQNAWVMAQRAYVHGLSGDTSAAIEDWSKAIALCAEEPHFFFIRGIEFLKLGRAEESVSDFTKVIALCDLHNSDYYRSPAYLCRADAHLRLKELAKARSDCEHVPPGQRIWTDRLVTREHILSECT